MTTEIEKYHAGEPFRFLDPEIAAMKENGLIVKEGVVAVGSLRYPATL